MPMVPVPDNEFSTPPTVGPYELPPRPPAEEIFPAALRGNWLIGGLTRLANTPPGGFPVTEGYYPLDDIKNNPLWMEHAGEFAGSGSTAQTMAIGRRIDQRAADNRTMAASGPLGVIAGTYASLLDPTLALPGAVAIDVLRGVPVVRGALQLGAGAGVQSTTRELLAHAQDPSRPVSESVLSVASDTLIGGLLGGAAALVSPGRRAALGTLMDGERDYVDAHVQGEVRPTHGIDLGDGALGRLAASDSLAARRAAHDLTEAAALGKVDVEGKSPTLSGGPPLDVVADTQQGVAATKLHDTLNTAWTEHNLKEGEIGGERTTFEDFKDMVGDATMAGGVDELPQVQRAAAETKTFFEELSGRAGTATDFPHLFDKPKIVANREAFEKQLTDHLAVDQEAKAPKKPAEEAPKPFETPQEFEARTAAEPDVSMRALAARARKITDDILAVPDGQVARTPMLDLPHEVARDWIVRDPEKVAEAYMRTTVPDALVTERFGDPAGAKMLDAITKDYAERIEAAQSDGAKQRLTERRDRDLADVTTLLDRLRGNHTVSSEAPLRNIGKIAEAVKAVAGLHMMGLDALQSLPELATAISHWGLQTVFRDAWQPLFKSLTTDQKLARAAQRQAKVMGIALDTVSPEAGALASTVETTLQAGADPLQLFKMLAPQLNVLKTAVSLVSSTGLYRAAKAAAKGTASEAQLAALRAAEVGEDMWPKIVEHYEKSGVEVDGHLLPNTEAWPQNVRDVFEGAVRRDANLSITNPGIDKPSFVGEFVLGLLEPVMEHLSAATTELIKANLPRWATWLLQGYMGKLALSALSYKLQTAASGKKSSKDPGEWLTEIVNRSGILGEGSKGKKAATGVEKGVDLMKTLGEKKGSRRREEDRGTLNQLVGPTTMDKLESMVGQEPTGTWTASDVTAKRRLDATQRLHWLNRTLEQANRNLGTPSH